MLPPAFVVQEIVLGSLTLMDSSASLIVRTLNLYDCSVKKITIDSVNAQLFTPQSLFFFFLDITLKDYRGFINFREFS